MKRRLPLLPCLFAVLSLLPACSRTPEPPPFAPRASPGEKELALIRSKLGDFDAPLVMTLWSREGKDPRGAETGSLLSAMGKANPRITVRIEDLAAENAPRTLRVPQGPGHGPLIRVESPWGSGFLGSSSSRGGRHTPSTQVEAPGSTRSFVSIRSAVWPWPFWAA